jgi:hypothetical protein
MQITNKFGLPETLVRAVEDDEYTKGDSVLSVTQLISPPRIVLLQDLNADKLTVDVVDRIPALFGSAVHRIVEKGERDIPGHIVEERLFTEVNGWKISGAVDLQIDNGDGTWSINDYKVTSVYSVQSDKPEWEQQLNMYACFARRVHGRRVTSLKIIAILRDWQRKQAELKADYPVCQVATVEVPVWSDDDQETFLLSRVMLHQSAKEDVDNNRSPTYCSNSDRWLRGESWAVMKEGRKSAVKLYDNQEDALAAVKELGASIGLNPGHYVEHRPGNYIRCSGNYCLVAQFCKQWADEQAQLGGGTGEGSG